MGQITLPDIKRKLTCPVLFQNKQDYLKVNPEDALFHIVYWEIMHWYGRKMRPINPMVIDTAISQHANILKVNQEIEANCQIAFKNFISAKPYAIMDQPFVNVSGQIGVKSDVITYDIPIVTTLQNKWHTIFFTLPHIKTADELKATYESRFAAIWAFYSLNRYPRFYNFYFKDQKIEQVDFKVDQKYVMTSIKLFANIINTLTIEQKTYPAPSEICLNCSWREECPTRYL